jgi:MoaA/NifB/PqqE/SkfB family radical SAM enzyme
MSSIKASLLFKTIWALEKRFQVNGSTIGAFASGRASQRLTVALRHGTLKKLFNLLSIELQLRLGRTKVSGYPYEWEVDTTNICQLKCPLCHTGLGTVNRDKGVMHFDLFKKTVDEIKDYCIWLSLYSWGEPFLNKEIDRYVAYANQSNVATIMSSNLNKPLTPDMAERLIRSGLDVLIVSLDGITQDVYEVYRVGGHLDRVLENIKLLSRKKKELGSKTPYIEWQFIVMRQNEHQVEGARRLADQLEVDGIVFKKVDFPHGENDPELTKKWVPIATEGFRKEQPFAKPYDENGARCWRLWRSGVVNWDGGYAPCCYLTDASDDFGNVNANSIKEIWNGEHYVTARGLFDEKFVPTTGVGCMNCDVYLETKAAKKRGPFIPLQPSSRSEKARNDHKPHELVSVTSSENQEESKARVDE